MNNPDFNKIISAPINAAHLFSLSGFLNESYPGHNAQVFSQQCFMQVGAQGVSLPDQLSREHYDMLLSQTVDFAVPICAILDICEMLLEEKNATDDESRKTSIKFLMSQWNVFPLKAAEYLIDGEQEPKRFDELGPESLN